MASAVSCHQQDSNRLAACPCHPPVEYYVLSGLTEFLLFKYGELSFEDAELAAELEEAARNFVDVVADR